MKVLVIVDHARGTTGPHRNVVGSLNALVRRDDIQLRLLCSAIDPDEPYARSGRIEIMLGYSPHDLSSAFRNIALVAAASRGRDLIYVPSGLKSLLYAQAVRGRRPIVAGPNVSPLPFSRHDSPGFVELQLMSRRWIEASEARRDFVMRSTGHSGIRVVHHGIDLGKWTPDKRTPSIWNQFGVPMDGLKVLFVGRDDEPNKGVAQLMEAFELARLRNPSLGLQLVLAGNMSAGTLQKLERISSAYHLGFLRSELLARVYASSHIAVVPSCWEAFGFAVLEALASGLAVIATRGGGVKEQIVDGESGILIDISDDGRAHRPDAAERIADAIELVASDPALRQRLGAAARTRAETHFSECRLGQDLMDVFHDACGRRASEV